MIRLCGRFSSKRRLSQKVAQILDRTGYNELYPVQIALNGELEKNPTSNVIVKSTTGSGKTLAFIIPILERLISKPYMPGTEILIVVPTRDLAVQV